MIEILYVNRDSGEIEKETVLGERFIRLAYTGVAFFPFLSFVFFLNPILSYLLGRYCDCSLSRRKIASVVKKLKIDESEFLESTHSFTTFNEFFTRRLKPEYRPYDPSDEVIISPADGRAFFYPRIKSDVLLSIKDGSFSIDDLLPSDASDFYDGGVAVIRLSPADYHRFHFPCSGEIINVMEVPGTYHSINPIALAKRAKILCENKRVVTLMSHERISKMAMVEVGAFGVASIVQTWQGVRVKKYQEKGYFKYGGSTIVLVFQKDSIGFSADLIENSEKGFETLVKVGETIATVRRTFL